MAPQKSTPYGFQGSGSGQQCPYPLSQPGPELLLLRFIFSVTQLLRKFLFHLESILFFLYQQAASFILHQEVDIPPTVPVPSSHIGVAESPVWQSVAYGHSALGISFNILMWPFLSVLRFILFSINCVCMCVRAHVCSPMETGDIGFS